MEELDLSPLELYPNQFAQELSLEDLKIFIETVSSETFYPRVSEKSLNILREWYELRKNKPQVSEEKYEFFKYMATKDNFRNILNEYGVAIISDVLNEEEQQKMIVEMWDHLEHITSKFEIPIDRENSSTWSEYYKLMVLHSMLMQHWGIGQSQMMWNLRENPKIVEIFCKLWNTKAEDLLVSFDGASFHIPHEMTNRGFYRNKKWFHTDQRVTDSSFKCIQSWITAYDVNEGDGTLTFLEGSHKFHHLLKKGLDVKETKGDWYKLDDARLKLMEENGCKIKNIMCPAGSLVLWDSRTVHAGKEPLVTRLKPNFRCVAGRFYIE